MDEPRFGRNHAMQRAAEYISRAENALQAGAGTEEERLPNVDPSEALQFASAAAAVASALIAYTEAEGPANPTLR